ncbi:MAG: N-acetyl-gamma-glutamyl-phosphate reductase [Clostridiales bacterium]|nr:N-acetyl-gamma-glutamyl-phosphate reductase [Clostridiales bacterium]
MNKIKVGIIGATGYAGAELVRLLVNHPAAEITAVSSVSYEGQRLDDIYPNLKEIVPMTLESVDEIIARCDVVFASVPHGVSEEMAVKCQAADTVLIDLGADFRLNDEADYKKWYGKEYKHPELHEKSVYCIPELHRDRVKNAPIIGNPGCYPTSISLGLMPAIKSGIIETAHIIIDSKSGVTGAGRGLTQGTHYPDTNEAFAAYKAGCHRHAPEIEQTLTELAGSKVKVTFVPHLLPVNRGIESSMYVTLNEKGSTMNIEQIHKIYTDAYANERFVRVEKLGNYANIKNVRMSNYCDISLHLDEHCSTLIISSVIDNMVKGAAGQALQNMNIRFGLDESTGLLTPPPAF